MRVAIGGYIAAVNSFVHYKTDLNMFQRSTLTGDAVLKVGRGETCISGFLDIAEQQGWEAVPLPFSVPGVWGTVTTEAHEWLKEQVLSSLRKAGRSMEFSCKSMGLRLLRMALMAKAIFSLRSVT